MSKRRVRYLPGKGISKISLAHENQKLQRNQDLTHYKEIFFQCGKCGTCRTVYKDANWSRVCPSGEFGQFEAYYLGGKNLLTWAIFFINVLFVWHAFSNVEYQKFTLMRENG